MWQRVQPQAVTAARYWAGSPLMPHLAGVLWVSMAAIIRFSPSTCCPQVPLQKLLFSATLTQDPEKLQRLGLYQPRLFSSGQARGGPRDGDEQGQEGSAGKYAFPVGLTVSVGQGCGAGWPGPGALANPTVPFLCSTTMCPAAFGSSRWSSCTCSCRGSSPGSCALPTPARTRTGEACGLWGRWRGLGHAHLGCLFCAGSSCCFKLLGV